ncbi:hypothetical protein SNE40_002502 [Patella caerulea]|uniref:[histone H4]-lysine(20) N-methyltransferase n=1 Tax=Patella caerulea TaxID=87958 RepID=A0AAN8Q7J0_PATCE
MATRKKERIPNGQLPSSKITDFYTSPVKIRNVEESTCIIDVEVKEEPVSELDISLQSSSVILTPDSSPCKDKELTNNNTNNNNNCELLSLKLDQLSGPDSSEKCHIESLPDLFNDNTTSPTSASKSTNIVPESGHCKHILQEDIKTESSTSSPVHPAQTSSTSLPKKRKGRKGKVKSTTATVKSEVQPKAGRKKKLESDVSNNKTITDFFPVRRSGRKCQSEIQKMRMIEYEVKVLSQCEDGLEVVDLNGKGRGVIATKPFKKGDFIVEYAGDLINLAESKDREEFYGMSTQYGCYMYYFTIKDKRYCIDATAETGKLGRLLNHSRHGNCCTKLIEIKDCPFLILIASRDIVKGEELLYDYGDRSKESIAAHPWLKS